MLNQGWEGRDNGGGGDGETGSKSNGEEAIVIRQVRGHQLD